MELKLNQKEVEAVLLAYVQNLMPDANFNRIEWEDRYSSRHGATFDHTDLPPEDEDK